MGKKPTDPIVNVVDIESTCWERGKQPPGMDSEIIEIGICQVDTKELEIISKESILVTPTVSTVSRFCTDLTTLTYGLVMNEGICFNKALYKLVKTYKSKKRVWFSWGAYDRKMFEHQCKNRGLDYPFGPNHINLKNLVAIFTQTNERGMSKALDYFNLPLKGIHHRGHDDAENISNILIECLKKFRNEL